MATTFGTASMLALAAALDAIESGLDTAKGRRQLLDARVFTVQAVDAAPEGSAAEEAVAENLVNMLGSLTYQANARV